MYISKNAIISIIAIILSIVLFSSIIAFEIKDKNNTDTKFESLNLQASPYKMELTELKRELTTVNSEYYYVSDKAKLMLGFILSQRSDVGRVKDLSEQYGFTPVFILNCTDDLSTVKYIIGGIGKNSDIMLYLPTLEPTDWEKAKAVKEYLASVNKPDNGILLIHDKDPDYPPLEQLTEYGFIGYTTYRDEPISNQLDDGTVYFEYTYLKPENFPEGSVEAFDERLKIWYESKAAMICVFTIKDINNKSFSTELITAVFDSLKVYTEYTDCDYSTATEVITELSGINLKKAEYKAKKAERTAEINKRIDELEQIINSIYRQEDS